MQCKALAFMSPAHAGPLQCDTLRELFSGSSSLSPSEFQPRNGARCRSNVPLKTHVNVGASQEKVSSRGCFFILFWEGFILVVLRKHDDKIPESITNLLFSDVCVALCCEREHKALEELVLVYPARL